MLAAYNRLPRVHGGIDVPVVTVHQENRPEEEAIFRSTKSRRFPRPEGKWRKPRAFPFGGHYVLISSDYSRSVGLISILAIIETFLALSAYWGIAFVWDTHIHLLTSLLIAPLLLLRSPQSIKLGLRLFSSDPLDSKNYEHWPKRKYFLWIAFLSVISFTPAFYFAQLAAGQWLTIDEGWRYLLSAARVGATSAFIAIWVAVAVAGAVAVAVAGAGAGAVVGAVAGTIMGAGVGVGAVAVAVVGVVLVVGVAVGVVIAPGIAAGVTLRAIVVRSAATLWHPVVGVKHLAKNWRENTWGIDSFSHIELIPGITESNDLFSTHKFMGSFVNAYKKGDKSFAVTLYPILFIFFFIPAFLYRWYIKSAVWVYWIAAYFFWPVRVDQPWKLLTSSWGDVFRRSILLLLTLAGAAQSIALLGQVSIINMGLHPLLVTLLGLADPSGAAPWRWLLVVAAIPAFALLNVGSNQAHRFKDPAGYTPPDWLLKAMVFINRAHYVSLIALMVAIVVGFTLGYYPEILTTLHVPSRQAQWLWDFFAVAPPGA